MLRENKSQKIQEGTGKLAVILWILTCLSAVLGYQGVSPESWLELDGISSWSPVHLPLVFSPNQSNICKIQSLPFIPSPATWTECTSPHVQGLALTLLFGAQDYLLQEMLNLNWREAFHVYGSWGLFSHNSLQLWSESCNKVKVYSVSVANWNLKVVLNI